GSRRGDLDVSRRGRQAEWRRGAAGLGGAAGDGSPSGRRGPGLAGGPDRARDAVPGHRRRLHAGRGRGAGRVRAPRAAALTDLHSVFVTTPLDRLRSLGYELPAAPAPMASYVPTRLVPVGDGRA